MNLGAFSVSLAVKDIQVSKTFYEHLGFTVFGGDESQGWLILQNDGHTIGLFQGMFEKNMLTFNPGWNQDTSQRASFDDIRDIQRSLKDKGVSIESEVDESGKGPASFVVIDPDGNPVLLDQHV